MRSWSSSGGLGEGTVVQPWHFGREGHAVEKTSEAMERMLGFIFSVMGGFMECEKFHKLPGQLSP